MQHASFHKVLSCVYYIYCINTSVIRQDSSNTLQWGSFVPAPAEDGLSADGFFWYLSCCTLWCLRSQRTAAWPRDFQLWAYIMTAWCSSLSALCFLIVFYCMGHAIQACWSIADILLYIYIYICSENENANSKWMWGRIWENVATCFDTIRHIWSAVEIIEMACLLGILKVTNCIESTVLHSVHFVRNLHLVASGSNSFLG